MKYLKVISILMFFFLSENQGFSQDWEKWYGKDDLTAKPRSVLEHYDRGYVVGGNVSNYEAEILMPWIIKTDINGDTLWAKLISSFESLSIRKINKSADGGFLLCGIFYINSKSEPFAAKLNTCGEKEWCTVFQTYFELPWAQDIVETPSGEIGVIVNQFDEGSESYLFKLDSEGGLIWRRPFCDRVQYQDSRKPIAESLIFVEDEFLITGNVYWKNPDDDLYPIRPLFTMYDSDGNEKFVLPFGVTEGIIGDANASIHIESDKFIGVGSYWTDKKDALIMEFDNQGNELNYKIFNSSEIHPTYNASVLMSAQKINDRYYFESYAGVEISGNPVTEFSTTDDLFGSDFEVLDLLQHPDSRSPISEMVKTHDDKLLCAMTDDVESEYRIYLTKLNTDLEQDSIYTGTYEYDYLCDHPIESGIIYFDNCNIIVGTEEIPTPNEYLVQSKKVNIHITPNPAKSTVKIEFEGNTGFKELDLQIFNINGETLFSRHLQPYPQSAVIDISNLAKGVYLVAVRNKDRILGREKLVVE